MERVRADIATDHEILERVLRNNEVSIWNTELLYHVTENDLRLRVLKTWYYISVTMVICTTKYKVNIEKE